ncbi:hypothetical protein THAOC_25114 [Thalassiosira oceanica]|uniref:Beta-carotene isomerase D27-like C-terminal domain-containing protein n=1 Tax=Thalassiosira oceanica TaxID=159749 RepID=K0RSA0_THAOC|nr:hypothetical protein THAOC_25114 [Thalassiosira oceanica]|eukprot:EJK55179.1 hypothetical protein THAOC_25114 [Thalassiosira oceanica]
MNARAVAVLSALLSSALLACSFAAAFQHHPTTHVRRRRSPIHRHSSSKGTIDGPPLETKPNYDDIHGPLGGTVDRLLLSYFRIKMAERLARPKDEVKISDSSLAVDDFDGIISLTSSMNALYNNRTKVQEAAQDVLVSLFPRFILDRYPSWFARPFPTFSARMCAAATTAGGTWLMGECEVNDVEIDGTLARGQGVHVKRCRFLDESSCASICVNSCKVPTERFFAEDMGLALTMTPDYETGECQFAFGKMPSEEELLLSKETPCLRRCPSRGGLRKWHDGSEEAPIWIKELEALTKETPSSLEDRGTCALMED